MNKIEKQLRQQIKDLEKLVEIKEAIINELKSIIHKNYYPYTYISSGAYDISVDASDANSCFSTDQGFE